MEAKSNGTPPASRTPAQASWARAPSSALISVDLPAPGAPVNLAQRLVGRLKEWTGQPWLIAAQGGGGAESAWERQKREEREVRVQIEADPFIVAVMSAFPGAEIVSVRNLPVPEASPMTDAPDEDEDD